MQQALIILDHSANYFSVFGQRGIPQEVKNLTGCGKTMSAREDFEGVTIHDPDHFALILSDNDSRRERQESAEQNEEPQSAIIHQPHEAQTVHDRHR